MSSGSVKQALKRVAAGVRRIEAATGWNAYEVMAKRRAVIYQNMFPKKDSVLVDSLRQLMAPPPKDSSAKGAAKASEKSMEKAPAKNLDKKPEKASAKPHAKSDSKSTVKNSANKKQ